MATFTGVLERMQESRAQISSSERRQHLSAEILRIFIEPIDLADAVDRVLAVIKHS